MDPLLTSFTLKNLTLKNRIVSTAHEPAYTDNGMPGERYQRYHEVKAEGGLSLSMFGGSACVGPDSPPVFGQLNVGVDRIIPYFESFSERLHKHDCGLICQLSHMGRRTTWNAGDWLPVVAPSRVREPAHRAFPKAMDHGDIKRVIQYYADAARRCQLGGLDGVEIISTTHLPGQFLSPDTNTRTDGYGGSLANRMRFTLEMLEAIRSAVGDDFIVGIRSEIHGDSTGGLSAEEGMQALRMTQDSGLIDYLNLNHGRSDTNYWISLFSVPPMWQKLAPWLQLVGSIRQELNVPVVHACRISDVETARYAIDSGMLDLVGMTRAHIADPNIVTKIEQGNAERIRPCVGAGYCIDRIYGEGEALCLHNVATGRESTIPQLVDKSTSPAKKVVVVGAGPAGLEAARVCAERGHEVVLYEAAPRAGGQVLLAARAGWRKDLVGIVDWLVSETELLGVTMRWQMAAREDILAEKPDIVIMATGGIPDTDYMHGGEFAISSWEALSGAELRGRIMVYDDNGQHTGVSCANYLAEQDDCEVILATPDRHAAAEMGVSNYPIYMQNFYKLGVKVIPDYRLTHIHNMDDGFEVSLSNEFGGPVITETVDHVVVEHGSVPVDDLFDELTEHCINEGLLDYDWLLDEDAPTLPDANGIQMFRVGDAVTSRNIHAAILDSRRLCMRI